MTRRAAALALAALVLACALAPGTRAATRVASGAGTAPPSPAPGAAESPDPRLAADIARLAPQRPGHADLYVLAVAGDGNEDVFRNEVLHLERLAAQRLDAAGRSLVLANHAPSAGLRPLPAASEANLREALAALGRAMDPAEDLLLLYLSSHGTEDHGFVLARPGEDPPRLLRPARLRQALDASGIRHRVLVVSACFSGGFVRDLRDPNALVITAAHRARPSFGCGNDSVATYFGRAWLVDGLNATLDFEAAFELARVAIEKREIADGLTPSLPQINRGAAIGEVLARWRAGFTPGPALAYAWKERAGEDATAPAGGMKSLRATERAGSGSKR